MKPDLFVYDTEISSLSFFMTQTYLRVKQKNIALSIPCFVANPKLLPFCCTFGLNQHETFQFRPFLLCLAAKNFDSKENRVE